MDDVIARLRFLTFLLLFTYVLSIEFFKDISIPFFIFTLIYSGTIYFLIIKGKIKESFIISLLDLILILSLFYFKILNVDFLFLTYLPVIKEVICRRFKEAYIISFLGNIALILISGIDKIFISLEISCSLLPLSFLIPYISIYYAKEKGG